MRRFGHLEVSLLSNNRWKLERPFWFDSRIVGRVNVPAGFQTDFASVPRVPVVYWLTGDTARKAAVIHDWLYRTQEHPRRIADAVLFEASNNEPRWRRLVMWAGVRVFGWIAWREHRKNKKQSQIT